MRTFVREQSLSLVFFALFLFALAGQALAGWHDYNLETWHAQTAGEAPETLSLGRYLTSSSFAQAVTENWQSEGLQFTLFILLTVWFVQKGSPESKRVGEEGGESDEQQHVGEHALPDSPAWAKARGWRLAVYSNSLVLVMAAICVWCWFAQSVSGWSKNNAERIEHEQAPLSWGAYLGSADPWRPTLQNWQSEFLAVDSMAVLAIYLRQRGSPESKPVGCPHHATSVEG
jgi:uncharacterized protein DUF6766